MLEDGTYDKDGLRIAYPDGYQVGTWDQPIGVNMVHDLKSVMNDMAKITDEIGVWTDTETGKIWVEPCVWIPDLDSALRIARALNQVAIWDWANMKEIRLN